MEKTEATELLGTRISHYRLIDLLGQGGMGLVYAGYDEKLDRKVALKSIRADHRLMTEAKARFLREARVLSQLAHPNICQIYDYIEGEQADYLVLELILGQRLTVAMKKAMDERLKLRIAEQIAGVLTAAHEKGIVHRDLKPDNVMLDEGCQVKVLDFGLSRSKQDEATLLAQASTRIDPMISRIPRPALPDESEVVTLKGTIMGTIGYMSPEQARGEEVTAASDMYSFGLILQELFTGKPTYDATPSSATKLEKVKAAETLPVEGIDSDLAALISRMKSLAPAARPSAVDAAERLAWIRNKPARRRKKILMTSAAGALALFAAAMTWQFFRATQAEKRAKEEAGISQRVSDFLVSIFQVSDPGEARGNTITAKEILDSGAAKIETELKDQPAMQARLMSIMGNVYKSLGLYGNSEALLAGALKIREKTFGPEHEETAHGLNNLATLYMDQGKFAEAEPLFKRALALSEKFFGQDAYETGLDLLNLANLFREQGKFDEAEPIYKRALAIIENNRGPESPDMADVLNNLGGFYLEKGRFAEAESLFKRTLEIHEKTLGQDHPRIAEDLNNLYGILSEQGKDAEAEPLILRALAIREKVLGPEHPEVATSLNNLGMFYMRRNKLEEAEPALKRALAIRERVLGAENPITGVSLNNLAILFFNQRKYAEAESLFIKALEMKEKLLGPGHPDVSSALNNLAFLYNAQDKSSEAEAHYKRSLAIAEKSLGPDHPGIAAGLNNLANLYVKQKRYAEAEPLLKRARTIKEKALGPEHPGTAMTLHSLAFFYSETRRLNEAEPLYKHALEINEKALGEGHPETIKTMENYARLLRKMKQDVRAGELEARAKAAREKSRPEKK